jgi:hypothetical protein
MRGYLRFQLIVSAVWLVMQGAAGHFSGLVEEAQAQENRSRYALIESPESGTEGVWCPPPDQVLVSDLGRLRAVNFSRSYGGESDVLANTLLMIYENFRLINAVVNLTAVAWEPGGDKLLVYETILDDSAKWFILDVGEGEYDKTGPERLRYSLGPRSYEFVRWTEPEVIVFRDFFTGEEVRVAVP